MVRHRLCGDAAAQSLREAAAPVGHNAHQGDSTRYEEPTGDDHGRRRPGGWMGRPVMSRAPQPPTRSIIVVAACATLLLAVERPPAAAASADLCRKFHQECTEARAAGYRDVGICHVERLECPADPDAGVAKRPHEARDDDPNDLERSIGERSIGP